MVGWDTPEPNAWGDDVRPIYLVGNRRRTKNPPSLDVGSVKKENHLFDKVIFLFALNFVVK